SSPLRALPGRLDANDLLPRRFSAHERDIAQRNVEGIGKKTQQLRVRLAVDGWRGEANLQRIAVPPGDLGAFGAGLHVQDQNDGAVLVSGNPDSHRDLRRRARARRTRATATVPSARVAARRSESAARGRASLRWAGSC